MADLGGPPYGPKFSQFHAVFRKIWQNHMLAPPPPQGWRPLLRGILDPPLLWDHSPFLSPKVGPRFKLCRSKNLNERKYCSGGSRISGRGGGVANLKLGHEKLLFGQFFPKNHMKIKETGPRGASLAPPWIRQFIRL